MHEVYVDPVNVDIFKVFIYNLEIEMSKKFWSRLEIEMSIWSIVRYYGEKLYMVS